MAATLVISDLHLGNRSGSDLLRRPDLRAALSEALDGIERVVLLGDAVELRQGPARVALAASRPFFEELGASGVAEVVLVPGNHDHALVAPWLERRRRDEQPPALGLEQDAAWEDGDAIAQIASWLAPARLRLAYPGVWLRDDVYATHGHYLDRHTTVPTFERLSAGVMGRIVGRPAAHGAGPDDYEAALAPIYAWSYALAQHAGGGDGGAGEGGASGGAGARTGGAGGRGAAGTQGISVKVWSTLAGDGHRPLRRRALAAAFPLGVAAINRTGIGPVKADISGRALGVAGARAMADAATALGIGAPHVIFGHTHRAGPLPGDDPSVWRGDGPVRLHNTGTWVFERHFLSRVPYQSPYWPGRAIRVEHDSTAPPELLSLLGERTWGELAGE
ncbi:metallophosphoesterase [Conexibacter sp. CPCC 206217]|uniref:metallophosphoesterase n=1 Tax=Conexibacter sp. CPCC 206217 TaxID=3064574 RepID=UPI0027284AA9|nr:metallophosphoesterase [Conexibacter sp. CPCC 206217]MDO8209197.1 metallophosphoesterase [Conexibacter sp. CPCC 206217]